MRARWRFSTEPSATGTSGSRCGDPRGPWGDGAASEDHRAGADGACIDASLRLRPRPDLARHAELRRGVGDGRRIGQPIEGRLVAFASAVDGHEDIRVALDPSELPDVGLPPFPTRAERTHGDPADPSPPQLGNPRIESIARGGHPRDPSVDEAAIEEKRLAIEEVSDHLVGAERLDERRDGAVPPHPFLTTLMPQAQATDDEGDNEQASGDRCGKGRAWAALRTDVVHDQPGPPNRRDQQRG